MKLWIIRHAHAESYAITDFERNLDAVGYAQCRTLAGKIGQHEHRPDLVLTSPLHRARQTAETLCEEAGWGAPLVQPWLACGMRPEVAVAELAAFSEFPSVAIVGHQPDLAFLVEYLCRLEGVGMKKAQAYLLEDLTFSSQSADLSGSYLP